MRSFSITFLIVLAAMTMGTGWSSVVYASFNCEHSIDAPVPMLACKSSSSPDGESDAWISLRKMPAWGTNAGLTIVDFCLGSAGDNDKKHEPTLTVSKDLPLDTPDQGNCMRRYCTDKKSAFSFFINTIPFPIGWTMVRFSFGREAQSFSISCDEFSSNI